MDTKSVSHLKHFSVRIFASYRKIVGQGAGQKCTGINAHRNNLPTIRDICWQTNALASSFLGGKVLPAENKSKPQLPTVVFIHYCILCQLSSLPDLPFLILFLPRTWFCFGGNPIKDRKKVPEGICAVHWHIVQVLIFRNGSIQANTSIKYSSKPLFFSVTIVLVFHVKVSRSQQWLLNQLSALYYFTSFRKPFYFENLKISQNSKCRI